MGFVFLAEDPRLRRNLAIKVMKPEFAENDTVRQRFLREARATAGIQSDHVVAIYEIGQAQDIPYIATELLHGKSLDQYLVDNLSLEPDLIMLFGLQIAKGLAAAHKLGVFHRDIKPANIWVEEATEHIKILDFGLSGLAQGDSGLTAHGTVVGTPTYMAPEQVEGKPVDARCDLFGLGCILYEMAAGKKGFDARSLSSAIKATSTQNPAPLQQLAPAMPAAFCDLVMQMLQKDPDERPGSTTEVVQRLQRISGLCLSPAETRQHLPKLELASQLPPAPPSESKHPPLWKRLRFRLACVLGASVVGAYLTYALTAKSEGGSAVGPNVQGVSHDEIVIGMSAPFSGPARELGHDMKVGIETCFREVNAKGGIVGRKLRLVTLDDRYDPEQALANMKKLDDDEHVFAVLGNVGTAEKSLPHALAKPMVFFGAYSGELHLRHDPPDRYVFNFRPSYAEETAAIVKHLIEVKHLDSDKIAVFAEQGAYGNSGFNGVAKALQPHGCHRERIVRVGYERNTARVGNAVRDIVAHPEIRAVIVVANYHAAAQFIQQLRNARTDLVIACVSSVGGEALADELCQLGPTYANGVIVTQVVPHPVAHSTITRTFREALHQHNSGEQAEFVSMEGYVDALILVEGLRRAGAHLNTESFVEALESIHGLDVGLGTSLSFGPSEHQASHKVWGTVLDAEGHFQDLDLE